MPYCFVSANLGIYPRFFVILQIIKRNLTALRL